MELLQNKSNEKNEGKVAEAQELASKLVNQTQIPNQYFEYGTILLINNSYTEDSLQEYSFYKKDDITEHYYKFESITVSWCTVEKLKEWLLEYDQTPVEKMKSISGQPLRESNRSIDHKISFEKFELYKNAFTDFAAAY
ncbi:MULTISPECIES: hypothetical protein [Metabacillus]|uniref:hypothetical protein n=1 Tax=Metabacillus TaxID=2675233 RepID=UPI000C806962|nr:MULTISPECIES: hypothetical protein [Metabacillus]MCM3443374.1 hypothetical protein [Metabacillus halosaccharovorans]PMC34937.1 hypothetical protein CJ195_20725 [Bacillus sp. UMB0899]